MRFQLSKKECKSSLDRRNVGVSKEFQFKNLKRLGTVYNRQHYVINGIVKNFMNAIVSSLQ